MAKTPEPKNLLSSITVIDKLINQNPTVINLINSVGVILANSSTGKTMDLTLIAPEALVIFENYLKTAKLSQRDRDLISAFTSDFKAYVSNAVVTSPLAVPEILAFVYATVMGLTTALISGASSISWKNIFNIDPTKELRFYCDNVARSVFPEGSSYRTLRKL